MKSIHFWGVFAPLGGVFAPLGGDIVCGDGGGIDD